MHDYCTLSGNTEVKIRAAGLQNCCWFVVTSEVDRNYIYNAEN